MDIRWDAVIEQDRFWSEYKPEVRRHRYGAAHCRRP